MLIIPHNDEHCLDSVVAALVDHFSDISQALHLGGTQMRNTPASRTLPNRPNMATVFNKRRVMCQMFRSYGAARFRP